MICIHTLYPQYEGHSNTDHILIWIRWFGWVPITGVGRWGWLQDYYPCPKYTFFLAGGETLQQMWPVIWQSMFFYHPLWGCTMMYPVFTVWSVCTGLRDVKGYCKQCSKHKERNFHGPMVSNGQITSWYLQPSTHPKWKNKPCSRTVPACRRCRWGGATCVLGKMRISPMEINCKHMEGREGDVALLRWALSSSQAAAKHEMKR